MHINIDFEDSEVEVGPYFHHGPSHSPHGVSVALKDLASTEGGGHKVIHFWYRHIDGGVRSYHQITSDFEKIVRVT